MRWLGLLLLSTQPATAADTWSLDLRRDGIAFTPDLPRIVMACGDELVVSFRDLQPFLNATGKREVAALQAELAKR